VALLPQHQHQKGQKMSEFLHDVVNKRERNSELRQTGLARLESVMREAYMRGGYSAMRNVIINECDTHFWECSDIPGLFTCRECGMERPND